MCVHGATSPWTTYHYFFQISLTTLGGSTLWSFLILNITDKIASLHLRIIIASLSLQKNLTRKIQDTLLKRQKEDETTLLLLGLMMGLSLVICPVILNAVYSLTTDIQSYSVTLADR